MLAMLSDAVAFLANTTAGIESIVQFGFGAAIALLGADLLLGIVAPMAIAWIEASVPAPTPGRRSTVLRVAGSLGAAGLAMASVLMLVFVLPWLGVVLAVVALVATVVVPVLVQRRSGLASGATPVGDLDLTGSDAGIGRRLGRVLAAVARRPGIVLSIAGAVTLIAATFAVQIETRFDVQDFFAADTDFVTALDQLDRHVGSRGGEAAQIYVEGDLTDPANLALLGGHVDRLRDLDEPAFARTGEDVIVGTGILEIFDRTWESPVMPELVAEQTGVVLTDLDGDAVPDTREQVSALLATAGLVGVPLDEQRLLLTPDEVNTSVSLGVNGTADATTLELQISDSRNQSSVLNARTALKPIAADISSDFGDSFVQATGSPLVREGSLEGTSRALVVSLPIALLACLAVASIFLRSIRYGIASVVPIVMVVTWLYAFMHLAGFAVNLVTATIAAVSIGIGIDFALHYVARFREELARHGDKSEAVRIAGEGTGMALAASAASSIIGFGILALAPMPLFATYGLLTALMIVMALAATLLVLPSVLVVLSRGTAPEFAGGRLQ